MDRRREARILAGSRGETLTETLVGLLIAALSLVMLTTALATSARIVTTTRRTTVSYQQATNKLMEAPANQNGPVASVTVSGGIYTDATSTVTGVKSEEQVLPGGKTGITYRAATS